jgi:hypothetical protein
MNTQAKIMDEQGDRQISPKKEWSRPVLDILEVESAQHGITKNQDRLLTHRSG